MCQVHSPRHRPVKPLRRTVTTRASPHPFRPIPFTIIWRPWRRAVFRTHLTAPVLLLATATLSLIPRIATIRRISTRTWCSRDPRRPAARELVPFFNAAIQKTAMPACTIILMRTYVFSVKAVTGTIWSRAVLTQEDTWPEAIPKPENTRTRTCTSRRALRLEIRRSRRSRRYIYPEWRRGRGPPTSKLVDRWTITRARLPAVVTKTTHRVVWVLTGALVRGTREDSTVEASRISLALRARTWRLGK